MSSLAEVVKAIRETNDAEARRKEAADKVAIANENKKFDDLTETLKKTSDESKRAQIEANIALIQETRAARKANEDNRSTAKKNLDENKQGLDILRKQIEDNGGKAEANLNFQKAANKIRREELALQKQSATNPSERKEIAKEQRKAQFEAVKLAFAPVTGRISNLLGAIKGFANIQTGIPGITLGRLGLLVLIPFIIKFLNSEKWKEIKQFLIENFDKAVENTVSSIKVVVSQIKSFSKKFLELGNDMFNLVKNPTFENLKKLFTGDSGTLIVALIALKAILNPLSSLKLLRGAVTGFVGAIGGVARGLNMAAGTLGSPVDAQGRRLVQDASGKTRVAAGQKGGGQLAKIAKGTFSKAALAARFAGPAGLLITGAIGVFSGATSAIEKYKATGEVDEAAKSFIGGFAESLSFGFLKEDTVVNAIEDTARELGIVGETAAERIQRLNAKIAAANDRIARSEAGENVYKGFESSGIRRDQLRILQLQTRLRRLEGGGANMSGMQVREAGGMLGAGQMALVGEKGPEFIMARSPMQVFSEARTDQLGMVALNRLMGGGNGGGGGGTMFLNTGSNVQNVNKQTIVTPIVDQDPVIREVGRSLAM
tara:strand:- start:125 stop:1927 length:1803 start_codon:yes stop_codon:yes gene_type:complete